MLHILPELYDSSSYYTARRDVWPEGEFIFGLNAREIANKDIPSTLVMDVCVMHYLRSEPLKLRKSLWKMDTEGFVEPWNPTQGDLHSNDWLIMDNTDVIKDRIKKLN